MEGVTVMETTGTPPASPTETTDATEQQKPAVIIPEEPPRNIYFECGNSGYVKKILKAIESFTSEATFKATPEGIDLVAMDPSRVAMVILKLEKRGFEEFFCPYTEFYFTVQIETLLKKAFKNTYKDERVRFEVSTSKTINEIVVRMKHALTRNFVFDLLETPDPMEVLPQPKIQMDVNAKLVLSSLATAFKDVESDHVQIIATENGLTFEQPKELLETHGWLVKIGKGNDGFLDMQFSAKEAEVESRYGTGYLKESIEVLNTLGEVLSLSYSKDMPTKLAVEIPPYGEIAVWIAPRIEQ
jgi:proliferating cell nuclear antigen PCNA